MAAHTNNSGVGVLRVLNSVLRRCARGNEEGAGELTLEGGNRQWLLLRESQNDETFATDANRIRARVLLVLLHKK